MTDLILGAIIIVLLGGFGWYVREQEKTKSKLINALLAKDSQEYVSRQLADQTEIVKPEIQTPSEIVSTDQLNDEEFDKHIQEQLNSEVTDEEYV